MTRPLYHLRLCIFALLFLNVGSAVGTIITRYTQQGSNHPHTIRMQTLSLTQVLQNSIEAMNQLKSATFAVTSLRWQMESTGALRGHTKTVPAPPAFTTTTASLVPTDSELYLQGSGYEILPHHTSSIQNSIVVSTTTAKENFNFDVVSSGNTLYTQDDHGQWYVLDKSIADSPQYVPYFSSAEPYQYNQLLTMALKVPLIDNGQKSTDGESLHHITAYFDKSMLQDLLYTMRVTSDKQTTQAELTTTRLQKAQLDLWINEKTFYVQSLEMDIHSSSTADSSSTASATAVDVQYLRLDYSHFNESGKITIPMNALATKMVPPIFQNDCQSWFQRDSTFKKGSFPHIRKGR